jgi:hypothetical protein
VGTVTTPARPDAAADGPRREEPPRHLDAGLAGALGRVCLSPWTVYASESPAHAGRPSSPRRSSVAAPSPSSAARRSRPNVCAVPSRSRPCSSHHLRRAWYRLLKRRWGRGCPRRRWFRSWRGCAMIASARCLLVLRLRTSNTRIFAAQGAFPLDPAPPHRSTSVDSGLRPCVVAPLTTRPAWRSRSSRWSDDETRTYATVSPPGLGAGGSTMMVPVGSCSAATGRMPSWNHRNAVR